MRDPSTMTFPAAGDPDYDEWMRYTKEQRAEYIKAAQAYARQEGAEAEAATQRWNAIAKYSGADAAEEAWEKVQKAIRDFKNAYADARKNLVISEEIVQKYGSRVPAAILGRHQALKVQVDDAASKMSMALAPLPGLKTEAGLGALPVIAYAAIIAMAAAAVGVAATMGAVQLQVNSHAQELVQMREQWDREDYQAGRINEAQLASRRAQTVAAAEEIRSGGAGAIGKSMLKGFGGIALAILAVGGVILALKMRGSKPQAATA